MKQEERVTFSLNFRGFSLYRRLYSPLSDDTLGKSRAELSSLNLKSSATLDTGRTSSHKEILGRQEDKEVRRSSKKAKLEPMIDEDSGDEDYSLLLEPTKPSRASPEEQTSQRTPDIRSVIEDTKAGVTPASVGSVLRKNADGSVAAPKLLPKRNKGSKIKQNHALANYWLTFMSFSAPKLEAKDARAHPPSGRIRGFF